MILTSINDLIVKSDKVKIVSDESQLTDGVAVAVKYVKRNGLAGDYIMIDDAVTSRVDLPVMREDLRLDVFNFFNTGLTNLYNRKMASGLCDVLVKDAGRVDQVRLVMGDYNADRAEFVTNYVNVDDRFTKLANIISVTYKDNLTADELKEIRESFPADDDVIPLIFATRVSFVKLDGVRLPTSKRLRNGDTLQLLDPSVTLPGSGLTNRTTLDNEVIVVTDDKSYLVGITFNKGYSIRDLSCDEFFGYRKVIYKLN